MHETPPAPCSHLSGKTFMRNKFTVRSIPALSGTNAMLVARTQVKICYAIFNTKARTHLS